MNENQQLIIEGLRFNSIRYKMETNWQREHGFFYALRFFTGIIYGKRFMFILLCFLQKNVQMIS